MQTFPTQGESQEQRREREARAAADAKRAAKLDRDADKELAKFLHRCKRAQKIAK